MPRQGISNIDDAGLRSVARLSSLRHLDFAYFWKVTDSGIEALMALPVLAHLDLAYCWQVQTTHARDALHLVSGTLGA